MGRAALLLCLALVIPLTPLVTFCHHHDGADHVEIVGLCHGAEAACDHEGASEGEEHHCEAPARHEKTPASARLRSPREDDVDLAPLLSAPAHPAAPVPTAAPVAARPLGDTHTEGARPPLPIPLRL